MSYFVDEQDLFTKEQKRITRNKNKIKLKYLNTPQINWFLNSRLENHECFFVCFLKLDLIYQLLIDRLQGLPHILRKQQPAKPYNKITTCINKYMEACIHPYIKWSPCPPKQTNQPKTCKTFREVTLKLYFMCAAFSFQPVPDNAMYCEWSSFIGLYLCFAPLLKKHKLNE